MLLNSDVVKEDPSPTWLRRRRTRRRSREKGNQEVGNFRFVNILQLLSIYLFFSITLRYYFFSIRFVPTTFKVSGSCLNFGHFVLSRGIESPPFSLNTDTSVSVVMGGTRCVVYSVISRRLEHPSVMDQVEYLYLHRVLSENVTELVFFSIGFSSLVVYFP